MGPEQVKNPENIAHIAVNDLKNNNKRKELDMLHLAELVFACQNVVIFTW